MILPILLFYFEQRGSLYVPREEKQLVHWGFIFQQGMCIGSEKGTAGMAKKKKKNEALCDRNERV